MTAVSRVTWHLSMRGSKTLGNIRSASCSLALDSARRDDTPTTPLHVTESGGDDVESALLLPEWNMARGTERAKFGSCNRFRFAWKSDQRIDG